MLYSRKKLIRWVNFFLFCFSLLVYSEDFRKNEWQRTDFIWNFGIISRTSVGLNKAPIEYFRLDNHSFPRNEYNNIKSGDIVWLRGRQVEQFNDDILPFIKNYFVLLISDGDESFPYDCFKDASKIETFINNPYVNSIFAQNCDYRVHAKVNHLPIGLDFHTIGYRSSNGAWGEKGTPLEQEDVLKKILAELKPTDYRIKKAFIDFHLSDTMHGENRRFLQFGEDRKAIFKQLYRTNLIDFTNKFLSRSTLWKKKGQYAFSVSPHGNGLDCHRTWEDLVLGCIVIVKTSALDPMYKGLPVVIIKNWSEVTKENLDIWLKKYGDAFTNVEYRKKLTNDYWLYKIFEKSKLCESLK